MSRIYNLKKQLQSFNWRDYYGWRFWYSRDENDKNNRITYESIDFDDPIPVRRAKILREIMAEMNVSIEPEELIVGHLMYKACNASSFPEYLSEEDRKTLHRTAPVNHVIANYEKVLQKGLIGIWFEADERSQHEDDPQKLAFLKSIQIVCEAGMLLGERYAAEAWRLSEKVSDPYRKEELREIMRICKRIPKLPAMTFREALQAIWFTQILLVTEAAGAAVDSYTLGRFDQYVYPFYKADLDANRITPETAQELVECLFIKYCEKEVQGGELFVIGGMDSNGQDSTNDVSYMCLRSIEHLHLPAPKLMARIHRASPDEFLNECVRTAKLGLGSPAFYNDEVAITALVKLGISVEEARNYAPIGCYELCLPGKEYGNPMSGPINLAKCLEWSLSDGEGITNDSEKGVKSGDPSEFTSFDDVLMAFRTQMHSQIDNWISSIEAEEKMTARSTPSPFLSAIVDGCIANATDISAGGACYNFSGSFAIGIPNVADSLACIKKLVFEEKYLTLGQLIDALKSDFKGYDELWHICMTRPPKYGNDDDYVDRIACQIAHEYCEAVSKYTNWRGGIHRPGLFSFLNNTSFCAKVSALPDGKKMKDNLASNMSPAPGAATNGPTAEIRSVTKFDYTLASNGAAYNIRLHPRIFQNESGIAKAASLVKTIFALGGMHVQFNVVDHETLLDAQKHPERHGNLVVRITGYSARFIEESKEIQDNLVKQTIYD